MEQILGPLLQRAAQQLDEPLGLQRSLRSVLERAARRALDVDVDVQIDPSSGTVSIVGFRRVVDRAAVPGEIELLDARGIDAEVELGDELGFAVELDKLRPFLRGALVVPAEQYAPLHSLLSDLMWDHEVLSTVARRSAEPEEAITRLVDRMRDGPFGGQVRPGCDRVELEAHEMMLGGVLPRRYRELLSGIGGMKGGIEAPRMSLVSAGYRLLSPAEAQQQHVEWTQRRDSALSPAEGSDAPAVSWNTDWLPMALGSRGAEVTSLLVIDPLGSTADRPGELLSLSLEESGWWMLGVDVAGLAYVWHTLALHDLLEFQVPGEGDPIMAAKAEAMARHLLPELRWVDGS